MPSGLRKTSGNHFEIYYEQPWGGVASNVNPVDIQPNQFVTCQGVASVNGELNLVVPHALSTSNFRFNPYVPNAVICAIFSLEAIYYAVDQFGYLYNNLDTGAGFIYQTTASDGPWAFTGAIPTIAVRVVNQTAYISVYSRNAIYTFNGSSGFTLGSNYVGGLVLGVLDDYLLMLNCNQASGGVSPTMISWSGPGEFTTWNPALNQLAGYNEVAGIDDQFTGFISLASVGISISAKGLTELTPTGVGIGPFSFTPLWTSVVGQGSVYPFTVTQYGQLGFCATDSGVYNISTGAGFSDISGMAKEAILGSFQLPSGVQGAISAQVAGNVLLQFSNSSYATPFYMLTAPIESGIQGNIYNLWMYDLSSSSWYQTLFNTVELCNSQNGTGFPLDTPGYAAINIQIVTLQPLVPPSYSFGSSYSPVTLMYFTLADSVGMTYHTVVCEIAAVNHNNTPSPVAGAINLVFRQEEIKLGREPTIRRVVIKAYGSGTLAILVSGVSFGSVTLNGSSIAKTYYSPYGMYTGEDPQLTITSANFQGSIIKVMLAGTYADGDID